jgi:hypothetical protein
MTADIGIVNEIKKTLNIEHPIEDSSLPPFR